MSEDPGTMNSQNNTMRPVPFRGGGFNPEQRPMAAVLAFILILIAWELGSRLGYISALVLPSPGQIGTAFIGLAKSGDLWRHVSASLSRLISGWILGTITGLSIGFAIGMFTLSRSIGLSLVSALFPIPKIALLPLFIIWFGIGEPSKIATIFFGVFFPTVINTYSSVDNVSRSLIRMGQSFNMSTFAIVRKIILPGALPGILAGFRISASIGIILLVAAEMIGAEYGIGALVLAAGNLMQTDLLIAGVVMLSLLGLGIAFLLSRVEARLLRWR